MNAIVKAIPPPAEGGITVQHSGAALYRVSTDAAALCRDIVLATASNIQGRKYVQVEGWQAIALAHGCAASSGDVIRLDDGSVSATGKVIRIDTGTLIASAEGYVGADEPTWFGGAVTDRWGKTKVLPKRADYAIRAMAQTRAISRACRSAFAHVVVMMNVGLSTTPAEEVPEGGFEDAEPPKETKRTYRQIIDETAGMLSACDSLDAVVAVGEMPAVLYALANGNASVRDEMNVLLSAAFTQWRTDPDPGTAESVAAEAEADFPGDRP
jgi:hypothetical protein